MSAPAPEQHGVSVVEPTKASPENVEKASKLKEIGERAEGQREEGLRSAHCRRSASRHVCREGRDGAQPQLVWSVRNNDGHGAASTARCECDAQCAHSPRPFAAAALLRPRRRC